MCTPIPLLSHGSLSLANGAYTSTHCAIVAGLPGQHPAKCKAGNSSWKVPSHLPPECAAAIHVCEGSLGFRKLQTEKSIHIETWRNLLLRNETEAASLTCFEPLNAQDTFCGHCCWILTRANISCQRSAGCFESG